MSYYQALGGNWRSSDYFTLSGTSMATPVVSGAAALLLQKNPALTPDQVKAILMKTASKNFPASSTATDPTTGISYTSYYDLFTVGAGYLDVMAALNDKDPLSSLPAESPTVVYDSSTNTVTLVNGTNIVWGSNIVWSDNAVWGSNIVWGTNIVWSDNVVWGAASLGGFNIVWGSNIVWDSTALAAESTAIIINGEN
jgi:serine protease AprX